MTSIEWTRGDDGSEGKTWNPTRGCSRVSAGCEHCYAERVAHRFSGDGQPYEGLTVNTGKGPRWTGEVRMLPDKLAEPLQWRKPRRVFVDSMSDLFHEQVPNEYIAAVFGIMAACPQHVFQVLTKRPERAARWFEWADRYISAKSWQHMCLRKAAQHVGWMSTLRAARDWLNHHMQAAQDSLPDVWLGTSVEDQATADERIPHLLRCPAAVRFVSYEPALGPVDFAPYIFAPFRCMGCGNARDFYYDTNPENLPVVHRCTLGIEQTGEPGRERCSRCHSMDVYMEDPLDWIIVGGESGPGARPFDVQWARNTIAQCKAAGVPVFVKQLGARPVARSRWDMSAEVFRDYDANGWDETQGPVEMRLCDRKGGGPEEWPEDLRVRQWPEVRDA